MSLRCWLKLLAIVETPWRQLQDAICGRQLKRQSKATVRETSVIT